MMLRMLSCFLSMPHNVTSDRQAVVFIHKQSTSFNYIHGHGHMTRFKWKFITIRIQVKQTSTTTTIKATKLHFSHDLEFSFNNCESELLNIRKLDGLRFRFLINIDRIRFKIEGTSYAIT